MSGLSKPPTPHEVLAAQRAWEQEVEAQRATRAAKEQDEAHALERRIDAHLCQIGAGRVRLLPSMTRDQLRYLERSLVSGGEPVWFPQWVGDWHGVPRPDGRRMFEGRPPRMPDEFLENFTRSARRHRTWDVIERLRRKRLGDEQHEAKRAAAAEPKKPRIRWPDKSA